MTEQGEVRKAPWTARQWLLVALAGVAVWFIGRVLAGSHDVGAVGLMVAAFGAIGLVWRLLKDR